MSRLLLCLVAAFGLLGIGKCPEPEEPAAYDCSNPPAAALYAARDAIEGEYLVVLKRGATGADFAASLVARTPQLARAHLLPRLGSLVVKLDRASALSLLKLPQVAYVQQVGWKSIRDVEWNLDRIDQRPKKLDGKYSPLGDGAGVSIAVVDTGISSHPNFGTRLQGDCFSAYGSCADGNGHGTHVAGTSAGSTYGVAPGALLYAVRVLDSNGRGTDATVIQGLEWVLDRALRGGTWVVNLSLGGSPAPALDDAVCRVIEAGVTVVVAAGNEARDARNSSPARVLQAVTVAAMQEGDGSASFTNRGPVVDLYAPGVKIRSTAPGGGTAVMQGTSMASPHVAGAAALYAAGHTPAEVEAWLTARATTDALGGVPSGTPNLLLYVGP